MFVCVILGSWFKVCALEHVLSSNSLLVCHKFSEKFKSFDLYMYSTITSSLWLCSHGLESRSDRRFGSRSKTWLGSWFELRAFTCIANAFPITIRICALRGNILLLLCSPCWLTHAWLQRASPKKTLTNHVTKELCIHISYNQAFYVDHDPKCPFFAFQNAFQKPDLKQLCIHIG